MRTSKLVIFTVIAISVSVLADGLFKSNRSTVTEPIPKPLTIDGLIDNYVDLDQPEMEKEEQIPVKQLPKSSGTPKCGGNEFMWLVCAVYFEARNQSDEGQYWVAQVILNRVHDRRWPNSIEGVVRQGEEKKNRCQFSFMCDGKVENIKNKTAWLKANDIVVTAMEDFYQDMKVTCAHSYRADYVTSKKALRWFASLKKDEQVDSHIFYCDKSV